MSNDLSPEQKPYSADYVASVVKELESRGWKPDEIGEPDCVDEASAAGADIIVSQARRVVELESALLSLKLAVVGHENTRHVHEPRAATETRDASVPMTLVSRLFNAICFSNPDWVVSRADVCDPIRDALPGLSQRQPVETTGLQSHAKWLRQAAEEISKEGHAGWGNTCAFAADAIERASVPPTPVRDACDDCKADRDRLRHALWYIAVGGHTVPAGTDYVKWLEARAKSAIGDWWPSSPSVEPSEDLSAMSGGPGKSHASSAAAAAGAESTAAPRDGSHETVKAQRGATYTTCGYCRAEIPVGLVVRNCCKEGHEWDMRLGLDTL